MLVYLGSLSLKKLNFDFNLHRLSWILNILWYNTTIFSQFHGSFFEDYVTNARNKKYNIRFSNEAHEIMYPNVKDDASNGGGRPLPNYST